MSETISLDWIGARLRAIQAEQRTLLSQYEFTRTMLSDVLRLLSERIGNFEALSEARIERVESRLGGIDTRLDAMAAQLDRIEGFLRPSP